MAVEVLAMDGPPTFDVLVEWASLSDQEIAHLSSAENVAKLQNLVPWLAEESAAATLVVTRSNFAGIAREMYRLLREGSRALGQTIIDASRRLEENRVDEARQLYLQFLSACGSRFYRDIAHHRLRELCED